MKDRNLDRDKIDFGTGKIGRLFRALLFPTLVGMVFNTALTIIDGVFVGQGVGPDGIAAVNIAAPMFMVITGIGLMLGIGASVVASIRLAEDNVKGACIIMTQAFLAGFVIIMVSIAVMLAFAPEILSALGCTPRLESKAMDYLLWLLPGFLFLFIQAVGMMLIRLDGSPRYAMWVQIAAAITNIFLDWYMIFPLGMGVKGASMATSIACGVGGAMVLVYFFAFSDKLRFYRLKTSLTSLLLTLRNIWYMAKIGSATFVAELAFSVMMLTGNYMFLKYLAEDGVAAYAIACYLSPLVFSVSNAVAQSAQPIISFNYGARQAGRVGRTFHISLATAALCGLLVSLFFWLGSPLLAGMFLHPGQTAYDIAVSGLPLFAASALFFSVNVAFIGYYQSIEKSGIATAFTLLRGVLLLVPCFLLLPSMLGVTGLWLAIPVAEFLTAVVIGIYFLATRRRGGALLPEGQP